MVVCLTSFLSVVVGFHHRCVVHFTQTKRHATLACQALRYADRPRYAGRLLSNLYGFRDTQQTQITLVQPVADVLMLAMREERELDFNALTNSERGCVRMFLVRKNDQVLREPLVIRLLDRIRESEAVGFLDAVRSVSKSSKDNEIKQAACRCLDVLNAANARQQSVDHLLRPATCGEGGDSTLLRPAGGPGCEPEEALLRAAAGD